MSVAVNKTYAVAWIKQMKHVLVLVLKGAKGLKVCCTTTTEGLFLFWLLLMWIAFIFKSSLDSQKMTSW